jgi:antitoxin component of MazEF toxin-antitoxin module
VAVARVQTVKAMKVKVEKWGDGLGVRLPIALVTQAEIEDGQVVEISVKGGAVELQKTSPIPRYRLEDLVAEMKRLGPEAGWPEEDEYSRGEITPDDLPKKNG